MMDFDAIDLAEPDPVSDADMETEVAMGFEIRRRFIDGELTEDEALAALEALPFEVAIVLAGLE